MPNNWVGKEVTYAETWNRTIGAWPVGQGVGSADMMAERNGALRQARIRNRKPPTAPSVSGQHASETGKPRCRLAPSHPLKAKVDGWSRKLWPWAKPCGISHSKGTSQPPASPVSTHPKQRNPSKIRAQRVATWLAEPPLGRQSRCSLAPSNPLKAKVDGCGKKLWLIGRPVSTHPKQRNASKIQAHRVATWSAEPLPFGTFEPAKGKGGWVGQEAFADSRDWLGGRNGPGQHRAKAAIPKARQPPIRNKETPARFKPNGLL